MEVEREVIDLYRAFFLRDRIGDVFDGVISGVTGFGVFVVVDEPFVEGLVRLEALSDDYYDYDEAAGRLVGRRSGRAFALGDTVQVEVQSVSVVRRKIDFALHEHRTPAARTAATGGAGRTTAGATGGARARRAAPRAAGRHGKRRDQRQREQKQTR